MKKVLIVILLLLGLCAHLFAQKTAEVSLRYSRQDDLVRVVLEAEEDVIRGSIAIASVSGVKIEFPHLFELKKPKDFLFETTIKERVLLITLRDAADVRAYRLSSPARIVMDIKMKTQVPAQKLEQKPQSPPDATKQPKDAAQQPQKPPASAQKQAAQKPAEPSPSAEKTVKYRTVVLDPGHGGYDYGIFRQDSKEKDINLSMAKDLAIALQKKGVKVFPTRKVDQSLSLAERISFSNSRTPDLFLGIHATASDRFTITTATAEEAGVDAAIRLYKLSSRQNRHIDKSRVAAKAIGDSIKANFKAEIVMRELPLPVLMSLDAPAILIEYPLTSQTLDQKERDRLVNAVMKGLADNDQ